jgi:hypothetical protein
MNKEQFLKQIAALIDQVQRRSMVNTLLPSDILTVAELAERLKVQPSWVYENQRSEKPVPALHCGRYLRFSWPAVCKWLAAQPPVRRGRKPARRGKLESDRQSEHIKANG